MTMKLVAIELRKFRSIGEKSVILDPWRKCNILIGRNNIGKSNVIKAMHRICSAFRDQNWGAKVDPIDPYRRDPQAALAFKISFEADASADGELVKLAQTSLFQFGVIEKIGQNGVQIVDSSFAQIKQH